MTPIKSVIHKILSKYKIFIIKSSKPNSSPQLKNKMNFNLPYLIPICFQYQPQYFQYPLYFPQTYFNQPQLIKQEVQTCQPQLNQSQDLITPKINESDNHPGTESSQLSSDQKSEFKLTTPIQKRKNIVQYQKESKNIQKNYAKAITSYIIKNKEIIAHVLLNTDIEKFLVLMKKIKNTLQNVCHISYFTDRIDFIKAFRILGNHFLKHRSTQYIFNSRILKVNSHLKNKKLIQHSLLKC